MLELYVKFGRYLLPPPPVALPERGARSRIEVWTPWPRAYPQLPAYTYDLGIARSQLAMLVVDVLETQRIHAREGLTEIYLKATTSVYGKLQAWHERQPAVLQASQSPTQPQLFLQ